MRQVVIKSPGELELTQSAEPELAEDQVMLKPLVVGICGSDVHAFEGKHPFVRLPFVPGHEIAATVVRLGAKVSGVAIGDRVAVEPNVACGLCEACLSGKYNICERVVVVGSRLPGAMADLVAVRADRLHSIPKSMTDAEAALIEPLATASHAVRVAGPLEGLRVAILGAGTIGLLTLLAALEAGAAVVVSTDLRASKRERAVRLGAIAGLDPSEPTVVDQIKEALGGRPDVTFDCVAIQASMDQAVALARKGGIVVVVGIAVAPVAVALPIVQNGEVRIEGSNMYVRTDMVRALSLLEAHAIPVEEIVTQTFPLDQVLEAFKAAGEGDQVKVQLRV